MQSGKVSLKEVAQILIVLAFINATISREPHKSWFVASEAKYSKALQNMRKHFNGSLLQN